MESHTLIFVGAVIGGVGAFVAAFGGLRLHQENAALSRSLTAKSEQIADLSSRIMASVTGGNSFVYLEPRYDPDRKDPVPDPGATLAFYMRQWGDYPSFDVVIRVKRDWGSDAGFVDETAPYIVGTVKRGRGLDRTLPFHGSHPGTTTWPLIFDEPVRPDKMLRRTLRDNETYQVEISARNGVVVQTIRLKRVGQRWHTDSRTIVREGEGPLTLPDDFKEAQEYHVADSAPPK